MEKKLKITELGKINKPDSERQISYFKYVRPSFKCVCVCVGRDENVKAEHRVSVQWTKRE